MSKTKAEINIESEQGSISLSELKKLPMFFIVGRPRSGTTLLRTLFDAHPNTKVPPECQFVIALESKYAHIKSWALKDLKSFYIDLQKQWRFDIWPLDKKKLYDNLLKMEGENTYGDVCKVVYFEYTSLYGHDKLMALGDKNPGFTIYTDRLIRIFPDAKFIHIVRDYRDNFVSLNRVEFEVPLISITVCKWKYFVERFNKISRKNPGSHILVQYEKLVDKQEETFKELCEFVGLPYSSLVFDFWKKKEEADKIFPPTVVKYQKSLMKKVNKSSVGVWKKELTEQQIKIADYCAGNTVLITGHVKKYEKVPVAIKLKALPGILFSKILYATTYVIIKLPYNVRSNFLNKMPWLLGKVFAPFKRKNKK